MLRQGIWYCCIQSCLLTFHAGKITALCDLSNNLSTVSQWYLLGIYLRLQPATLDVYRNKQITTTECRTQMLMEWQKHVTPTWSAVVKALVGIGREHLASHLAVKYGMLDLCFNFFEYIIHNSIILVSTGIPLPDTVDHKPLEEMETKCKMVRQM